MTSPAFMTWRSERLTRFDQMSVAHPDAEGSTTDPALRMQFTRALVLLLSSEFQGFCRDLHDDAVRALVSAAGAASNAPLRLILVEGLTVGRALNRRSADPKALSEDFVRLRVALWAELAASYPASTSAWRREIALLHRARNGVAHSDQLNVRAVEAAGWALELGSVKRWRNSVDETVAAMETVVSQRIAEWFQENRSKMEGL